jgi:KaiC/GvpD/RAD55 family RecA-like ATPase
MRRVKTGIDGLDQLTQGGLPAETITLVSGPAGSGKSLLCLQFSCAGAISEDEPALYVSLEESAESLGRALANYRFNDFRPLKSGKLTVMDLGWLRQELDAHPGGLGLARIESLREEGRSYLVSPEWMDDGPGIAEELESGMVGFRTLSAAVDRLASERDVKRLVIDSVAALGLYYAAPEDLRRELFRFGRFLRERHLTVMMVTESVPGAGNPTRYGVEHYVADAHIVLGLRNVRGEFKRTMMIQKLRFSGHDGGLHPFTITDNGIEVNAREYIRA